MARRSKASKPVTVTLPADCSVNGAQEIKTLLLDKLQGAVIAVDINGLERIDTAGAQLLLAFARDRAAKGLRTEWQGSNATLHNAVNVLGLASHIGLPAAAHAACP